MRILRPFSFCFRLLVGWGVLTSATWATTIRPPSFEELVDLSGRIVRAEVVEVRPFEDSHEEDRIVRTEIILNVLESFDGNVPVGELRIRHLGGEVNGLRLEVGAMPKFESGKEVVLFLHSEGRFICPTVGWGHGKYRVDRTASDGVARIIRSNGLPLQSIAQVAEPIHGGPMKAQSFDPLSQPDGLSLAQFRQLVSNQIQAGRQDR